MPQTPDEYYRDQRALAGNHEAKLLESISKYLLFTNAGGVAVLLAFTSAHYDLMKKPLWIVAIASFLVGVIVAGLYLYSHLLSTHSWIDALERYRDTHQFHYVPNKWVGIVGWLSFAAFLAGSALAIYVGAAVHLLSSRQSLLPPF